MGKQGDEKYISSLIKIQLKRNNGKELKNSNKK
jgi:hypothetical protein